MTIRMTVSLEDVRFLEEIRALGGPDALMAEHALAVLPFDATPPEANRASHQTAVSTHVNSERALDPASHAREILLTEALPDPLRPALAALPVDVADDLLTELLEVLLWAAATGRPVAVIDRGTHNLATVAWELSHHRRRAVGAFLPDPRVANLSPSMRPWADRLLGLVRPATVLDLAHRCTDVPRVRTRALWLLADAAPRLGHGGRWILAPDAAGRWPDGPTSLWELFDLARPRAWVPPLDGTRSGGEEPRSATNRAVHPRLSTPEQVEPSAEFIIEIGLAPHADATAAADSSMTVPDGSFLLSMEIGAEGCDNVSSGRVVITEVSTEHRFPCLAVTLRAPAVTATCVITVTYSVDGTWVGAATRLVHVGGGVPSADAVRAGRLRSGWRLDLSPPDVDITILRDDVLGRLTWLCHSSLTPGRRYEATMPLRTDAAAKFTDWMAKVERRRTEVGRRPIYLGNIGRVIADEVPEVVWTLLNAAYEEVHRAPTVLIVSQYGELPWELAAVPAPWLDGPPAMLGAQAVVGNWPLARVAGASRQPDDRIDLSTMAVLSWPGDDLPQAHLEANNLVTNYGAVPRALSANQLLASLAGDDGVEALHVAAHGRHEDGIELDGPADFEDFDIPTEDSATVRLAFLNACELARVRNVWGAQYGLGPGLVRAGADGVVAPLWQVDDEIAAHMARDYYAAVLTEGMPPAEFLRKQRAIEHLGGACVDRSAYTFTGHPGLTVTWAGGPSA